MNWLNSDKYKSGFEQGKEDAFQGKKRNLMSVKEGLKAIVSFSSKVYMDTYIKGYKEGFRIGLTLTTAKEEGFTSKNKASKSARRKTSIQTSNKINNSDMSRQVYHIQERQLTELAHFLNHFKMEIQERMLNYQRQVENMHVNGLPQETYEKFQVEHIDVTNALVQQIVDLIEMQSIPFIQGNIQRMQDLLDYNQ